MAHFLCWEGHGDWSPPTHSVEAADLETAARAFACQVAKLGKYLPEREVLVSITAEDRPHKPPLRFWCFVRRQRKGLEATLWRPGWSQSQTFTSGVPA